jgi:hypothetical protein
VVGRFFELLETNPWVGSGSLEIFPNERTTNSNSFEKEKEKEKRTSRLQLVVFKNLKEPTTGLHERTGGSCPVLCLLL